MTFAPQKKETGTVSVSSPSSVRPQSSGAFPVWESPLETTPAVPFTLVNSRSGSAALQRQAVAPALAAAALWSADQLSLQRAAAEVATREAALNESRQALADHGLRPAATSFHHLASSTPAAPLQLSAAQRQAATQVGQHQVTSLLTHDVRSLPPAVRAELAVDAVQRAVRQGADERVLQAHLAALAQTPREQDAVQRAVTLQRQHTYRETQRQAERALQMTHASLQRQLDAALAQQAEANLGTVTQRVQSRRGGGEPLPPAVQRHLEAGLNADLSRVRIHTDGEAATLAASVHAEAFTSGPDIYFAANRYDPSSSNGLKLLAHEVTHTVQQAQGQVAPGLDPDAGLEAQAQQMGEHLGSAPPMSTAHVSGARPGAVQRRALPSAAALVEALHRPRGHQDVLSAALGQALSPDFWSQVMALGSQKYGREWADAALEQLPAPLKARLTLALLGGEHELTYAAFINQLAYLVYSNDPSLSDAKQVPSPAATHARGILQAAGYQAHPTIHGLWGFQMRIFTPIEHHAKPIGTKTIVAFRGTEGVKFLPNSYARASADPTFAKSNESGLDTLTDLAAYPTGYSQYEANEQQIIAPALKLYGSDLVATGHSLGGALAQIAAAKNPNRFSEVYTFQGANINKSDVDKLAASKTTKSRAYRVTGDAVPSSGEKALPGQVYEFDRQAGTGGVNMGAAWRRLWKDTGEKIESLDISDGHNAPILLEVLEDLQAQGLVNNPLAQRLVKTGSQDPNELAGFETKMPLLRTVPSSLDKPGKEGMKQATTGTVFLPQFRTTYENNVVYNLLLEQLLPRLHQMTVQALGSPQQLVGQLTLLGSQIPKLKVKHTEQSLQMLDVIFKGPEAQLRQIIKMYKSNLKAGQTMPMSPYSPRVLKELERQYQQLMTYKQRFLNLEIPAAVFSENRARLAGRRQLLDLWYSVHPAADALYSSALPLLTGRR